MQSFGRNAYLLMALLLLFICILVSSCGDHWEDGLDGRDGEQLQIGEGMQAWSGSLPAPLTLKSANYTEPSLFRYGSKFEATYPHQNVEADDNQGVFTPDWTGESSPFSGLAFAVYQYGLEDYDRDETVRLTWAATGAFTNAWLGVANFTKNAWEWYAIPPPAEGDTSVVAFDFTGCIAPDDYRMLVLPLFTGTDPWTLDAMRIGEEPYVGVLDVTPQGGEAGEEVSFAADVIGTAPFGYSWDFGGGAAPNLSADEAPTVTLGAVGEYEASLTASNDWDSDTFEFILVVVAPGTFYIMPDPDDPDWQVVTGEGTMENPYILDDQVLNRAYSLKANTESDGSGTDLNVEDLTWSAFPPFIATWLAPGEFRANEFTAGYVLAEDDLDNQSNSLWIEVDTMADDPVADLQAEPLTGFAPLEVQLDASASYAKDVATIVKYEFDFDEGAGWEDYGLSAIAVNMYESDGMYQPQVRVTDNNGKSDTEAVDVDVWPILPDDEFEVVPSQCGPNTDFLQIFYPDPIIRRNPHVTIDIIGGTVTPVDPIGYNDVLKTNGEEFLITIAATDVFPAIVVEETTDPDDITGPDDPDAIVGVITIERHVGRIALDIAVITPPGMMGDPAKNYAFKLYDESGTSLGYGTFTVSPLGINPAGLVGKAWGVNVWDRESKTIGDAMDDFTNYVFSASTMGTSTPDILWFMFDGGWIYEWQQNGSGFALNNNVRVVVEDNSTHNTMYVDLALRIAGLGTLGTEVIATHEIIDDEFTNPGVPGWPGVLDSGHTYTICLDDVATPANPDWTSPNSLAVID